MNAELKNGAMRWEEATMQPSEMTNEELAFYIVNTIGGGIFKEYYTEIAARLNPDWVEWLMGWPIGWTALRPLATDRFRSWLHGRFAN